MKGRSESTVGKNDWLLGHARPFVGKRSMRDIAAPELLEVLQKVEAHGKYETANRLRGTLSSLFRYAIATGRADRDPAADLRGALITPKVKHRAAITDPKQVGALLRAIDGYEGSKIVRVALMLSAHLFMRPGELHLAAWSEFDLEIGVWTIPAERTKMRRLQKVPLRSGARVVRNARRDGGRWETALPKRPFGRAVHVGQHPQCRAATPWLCAR